MPHDTPSSSASPPAARSIGEFLISARSFAEYRAMFALTDDDLAGRVLDCPGGGASFTATVCARGGDATAADPVYALPSADLIDRLSGELDRGSVWTRTHAARYAWTFFTDPAEHDRLRTGSAHLFGEDLQRHPDRYVPAALPALPFADGAFDLVLSSHLLFTYADRLDTGFHLAALRELARVSRGSVRVYPLLDQAGRPLPRLLAQLIERLAADGLAPRLVDVDHEFQRGARTMLELRGQEVAAATAARVDSALRATAPHAPGGSMPAAHSYQLSLHWTGNRGEGTSSYRAYARDHELQAPGKPAIPGSADPAFRGDPQRWNPEELLVASLAQCHMLWYLHLAAEAGVIVTAYSDTPTGTMVEDTDGGGQFSDVVLHPAVTVAQAGMRQRAHDLHDQANALCFIARSVRFPVHHQPITRVAGTGVAQMGDTPGD